MASADPGKRPLDSRVTPPALARDRSPLARYGFAVVATAVCVGVYLLLEPLLTQRIFFILTPAVVFSAWYGGHGPGIAASFLSVFGANWILTDPVGALRPDYGADLLVLAIFLLLSLLMSTTVGSLRSAEEQALRARAGAERAAARVRELEEAGRVLALSLDYDRTLERIAALTARALGGRALVDFVEPGGALRRAAAAQPDSASPADERESPASYTHPDPPAVLRVVRTGEPVVVNAPGAHAGPVVRARRIRPRPDAHSRATGTPPGSVMIVPMTSRGQVVGALTVVTPDASRGFDQDDVEFATELADRAAVAVDNARLMQTTELAVLARDEVLGVVSHDLRNMLGLLRTTTGALLDFDLPEEKRRDLLERQRPVLQHATRLVDDLLDVTRMEAGRLELDREPVAPADLLNDAVRIFRPEAESTGIELTVHAAPDLPRLLADAEKMHRVLANLLSNAIKFTPAGGRIEVRAAPGAPGSVAFAVTDTGPGIDAESLPRVFDRFWQSRHAQRAGAGLGLSIAKGIVEAHGGWIGVESSPGEGSTFSFELPVQPSRLGAPAPLTEGW